jgi:endonuclease G, mitochondrial
MKRMILFIFFYCTTAFSQPTYTATDTVTLFHKLYATTFSKSLHYPVVVKYWVTQEMLNCKKHFPRPKKFTPDPLLPEETKLAADYKGSGYDRGHNMDAFDCSCNLKAIKESFYYSNMCPQTKSLNQIRWKALEDYVRKTVEKYDSVLVWCGSVSLSEKHIGKVAVPDYCWKIIYIKSTDEVEAYSFVNGDDKTTPFTEAKVSEDSVYTLSGFRLNK